MKRMKLFNKNFNLLMIGSFISSLGTIAASFAIGVLIFEETNSTLSFAIYGVITILPQFLLSSISGPLIDKFSKKKIIVSLDIVMGGLFLLFAFIVKDGYFNYYFFMSIGVIISTVNIFYQNTFQTLFPKIIPEDKYSKAYAINSLVWPITQTLMAPIAIIVLDAYGIIPLFIFNGISFIIASILELFMNFKEEKSSESIKMIFKRYREDLSEGIKYVKNDRGINSIFMYFFFSNFVHFGSFMLLLPFFKRSPDLTIKHYSILLSFSTLGRIIGGIFHYFVKIKVTIRYKLSVVIYFLTYLIVAVFLFFNLPLMLLFRMIFGFLVVNTFNIRMSSTQRYIPDDIRGRVNSIFTLIILLGQMIGRLLVGILALFIDFRVIAISYAVLGAFAVMNYIVRNKSVKDIYNQSKTTNN